ncbi:nidogen-2-like, partial [Astyanax mexicanus]
RPKTQCEQHRDSLQRGDGSPPIGAYVPQCDEQGQYRQQQCHGSTGHCWCVDSRGQERQGTRTPPGTSPYNCDAPERPKTQCEQHRDSLQRGDGSPPVGAYVPQCDDQGQYRPQQCHGSTGHCWCVDSRGQERQGTRTPPGSPRFNCDAPGKYIYSMEFKFKDHNISLNRLGRVGYGW